MRKSDLQKAVGFQPATPLKLGLGKFARSYSLGGARYK